jgi:hypothetical protein
MTEAVVTVTMVSTRLHGVIPAKMMLVSYYSAWRSSCRDRAIVFLSGLDGVQPGTAVLVVKVKSAGEGSLHVSGKSCGARLGCRSGLEGVGGKAAQGTLFADLFASCCHICLHVATAKIGVV